MACLCSVRDEPRRLKSADEMDRAAETLSDATLANTSRRRDSEASIVDRPLGVAECSRTLSALWCESSPQCARHSAHSELPSVRRLPEQGHHLPSLSDETGLDRKAWLRVSWLRQGCRACASARDVMLAWPRLGFTNPSMSDPNKLVPAAFSGNVGLLHQFLRDGADVNAG